MVHCFLDKTLEVCGRVLKPLEYLYFILSLWITLTVLDLYEPLQEFLKVVRL